MPTGGKFIIWSQLTNFPMFRGVMAIEHADFDGIERLALVTGGEIVSTFGKPELVKIGKCDLIEQVFLLS